MRLVNLLKLIVLLFFLNCSSSKQIIYIQDEKSDISFDYNDYLIKIDDLLKIEVNANISETALIYNPKALSIANSSTKENFLFNGYQVNSAGYIDFPSIGKLYVLGISVSQIRDLIYNRIIEDNTLTDPIVDVKLINASFTILGEVKAPGRYDFLENNLNILEAIGMAGDLTINGKRKDVKLIREIKGKKIIYSINLTSSNFFEEEYFQIFSGDVIIVNPNMTRIKNAGIIGNSGTLISLLTFILSSIIVIRSAS